MLVPLVYVSLRELDFGHPLHCWFVKSERYLVTFILKLI